MNLNLAFKAKDKHLISKRFPRLFQPRKSLFWQVLLANLLFVQVLSAQQPEPASPTTRTVAPELDTMPFLFTFALAPERSYPADDTLPDFNFRMYDPARRPAIDYGTLGNVGASARPLFFEPAGRKGFDPGFPAFDLYQRRPSDLQFFRNSRSFTDLYFSQGSIQNDNLILARFSRTFSGGLNFSLDWRNYNHQGDYRYQSVKHSSLSMGVWYPVGSRYEMFLIYANNTDKQQENGGIVTDTLFGQGQFGGPINAEVRLPDQQALTRQTNRTYQLTHHLKLAGAGDSSAGKRVLRATHTAAWQKQTFKFSDPGSNPGSGLRSDSTFFGDYMVDRRGLRHYWELQRIDNTVTLNTFKAKRAGKPSDVLALGLTNSLFFLQQEPAPDSVFSNTFLTGKIALTPSDRFAFVAQGDVGLFSNFGEYQVSGNLRISLGKAGEFRATLLSQRYPPSMLHRRLYISKRLIWQNDFSKPLETSLSATYALPRIGFEATGASHLVNNYLYFDQQGAAAQTSSPLQVIQLLLRENIRLGHWHFDNTVALQRANRDDVLRLPGWFTKNSLYYYGPIFKKRMLVAAGVDFRLNGAFTADGYQPLVAQFYLQDSLQAQPYPWLDVFLAFKVQSFRFFIRYENVSTLWDNTTVFYQTARYPHPFGGIRLGIGWRFLDNNQEQRPTGPDSSPSGGGPLRGPTGRGFR